MFAENVTKAAIEQAASDCASMGYKTEMLSLSAGDLAQTMSGKGIGYLQLPNDKSQLMRQRQCKRWQVCRNFGASLATYPGEPRVVDGGPIGWSDTKPLAMDKFQRWQQQQQQLIETPDPQMFGSEGGENADVAE